MTAFTCFQNDQLSQIKRHFDNLPLKKDPSSEELAQQKKLEFLKSKGIDPDNPHPGLIKEYPTGTPMEDGTVVGEVEASLYIEVFEKDLFNKLRQMDSDELRNRYAEELHWFQRVGNFRKSQKCMALQKMQMDFGLKTTPHDTCVANILQTEKETWGH